jgi:hypothetical protein
MPRALVAAFLVLAAAPAAESATRDGVSCGTVPGGPWTEHVQAPGGPLVVRGVRYRVLTLGVSCAQARAGVARVARLRTAAEVRFASADGLSCEARTSANWYRDLYNGDSVRWTRPIAATGSCTAGYAGSLGGSGPFHGFFWQPAKPCRSWFHTDSCP